MLVLSRKKDESVMLNDNVEIKILSIEGDQVKIGISAPKELKVYRKEVYEAILKQNQEALNVSSKLFEQIKKNI